MKRYIIILVVAALLMPSTALSQTKLTITKRADSTINYRPRVGVVLSGGGAKGIAHIGALKVLEELKIPVDYVTGTSIGSIIGGLYALGYTPDEMETLIINTDWNEMMKDQMSRAARLYEYTERDDRLILDVPVMNRKTMVADAEKDRNKRQGGQPGTLSNIPLALVEGQNLNSLFTQLSVGYQDNINFDDLPIPFGCVAVDLVARKPVVIRSGNIVDAIRSSMAIPGYFAPIMKDDMMLVDGGMLNNLPVDVVREMGADIVIAVDLHKYDKINFKKPDNVGDMVTCMLKIMNGEKYNSNLKDADICISPNTGNYGILDFTPESLKALSDSGYFAALEVAPALEKLALLEKGYWQNPEPKKMHAINLKQDSVHVSQISITGADPKETDYLMDRCREYVGEYVTGKDLDTLVKSYYNTRAFSKVAYSVANIPGDSSYILKMQFTPEKLHSVGLGLRFDTEEIVSALINVSLNCHKLYGWKAELDANLSYNPVISLSGGYAFTEEWMAAAGFKFRRSDLSEYYVARKVYANTYYGYFGDVYIQRKGFHSDLKFIHRYENARLQQPMASMFSHQLGAGVIYNFDNRDKGYFANRGILLRVGARYNYLVRSVWKTPDEETPEILNHPFGYVNFDLSGIISCGSHFAIIPSLMTRLKMGVDEDVDRYSLPNIVGGYEFGRYVDEQMPFVGTVNTYHVDNLAGIARVDFRGNFGKKHYVYLRTNGLCTMPHFKYIKDAEYHWGVGVGYEYDSFFGPLGFNLHYSDMADKIGFYINAGFSF